MSLLGRTDSSSGFRSLVSAYEEDEDSGDEKAEPTGVDNISDDDDPHVDKEKISHKRESETETYVPDVKPRKLEKRSAAMRLVSYGPDDENEELEDRDDSDDDEITSKYDLGSVKMVDFSPQMASALSRGVQNMTDDEILIPPEPPGKCSQSVQEAISRLWQRVKHEGVDLNESIQRRKDFRNPSIYEKLVQYCGIDEKGTNYPPEIYDPHLWGPESYYDELQKVQKQEMDKREREKKDKTKIEFVVGTKKTVEGEKRKSKWDTQPQMMPGIRPTIINATVINPTNLTASATGTKTTVISAVGSIKKPK